MDESQSASAPPGPARTPAHERRAHPRYAILIKGVAQHLGLTGAGEIDVVASDISEGGILLHTNRTGLIAGEDLLKVTFTPLLDGGFVTLQLRVVWMKENLSPHLGRISFGSFFYRTDKSQIDAVLIPAREANELKELPDPY